MSSPTKAPVERRHREATLHAFGWGDAIGTENSVAHWAETGDERNTFAADVLPVVAQALASAEATAYARGLADGAERERARGNTLEALMRWANGPGRMVWCGDTDSWYANDGDSFQSAETPDELALQLGIGESE